MIAMTKGISLLDILAGAAIRILANAMQDNFSRQDEFWVNTETGQKVEVINDPDRQDELRENCIDAEYKVIY